METRIDWLSFTLPGGEPDPAADHPAWHIALQALHRVIPGFIAMFRKEGGIVDGAGRAPFRASIRNPTMGCSIFYGHKSNLVLVEISGNGCEKLREFGGELYILERCKDRFTRVDVACDWEATTKPTEFASSRNSDRFKSGAEMHSETGETVYVGSRSSDRYARVYRYYPPHPRSKLLRCEMVLKDDQAKACVAHILENSVHETARSLGASFGWAHELWVGEMGAAEKLASWRANDRGGGTVRWLHTQVTPALERLIEEGNIQEVKEWLAKVSKLVYTKPT